MVVGLSNPHPLDPNSQSWLHVRSRAEEELAEAREDLEGRGLPDVETEFLRGRISALKDILALGDG